LLEGVHHLEGRYVEVELQGFSGIGLAGRDDTRRFGRNNPNRVQCDFFPLVSNDISIPFPPGDLPL
jgi:hypothetical protein